MSTDSRASQWLTSNLAAIGSAAVLTVYAAGYARTKPAADKLAEESERRRPNARPTPMVAVGHVGEQAAAPATTGAPAANAPASARAETSAANAAVAAGSSSGAAADTSSRSAPAAVASAPTSVTASATTPAPAPASTPAAPVVSQAPASAPAPAASQAPTLQDTATTRGPVAYKDGMYSGWGTSRHGDIQAYVEIKGGRIVSAFISECLTQYSCSWIARLPGQVVERQSAEIDYVSGATQSSNALYYAVVNALKTAK